MIAGTCVPWADTVVIETTDDAFAAVEQIEHAQPIAGDARDMSAARRQDANEGPAPPGERDNTGRDG